MKSESESQSKKLLSAVLLLFNFKMAAGLCVCTVCRGEDLQCGAPAHLRLDAADPEAGGAHRQGAHEEDDRNGDSSTLFLLFFGGGEGQVKCRCQQAGTLVKNKIKFSSYIRKFRMEQLQSRI